MIRLQPGPHQAKQPFIILAAVLILTLAGCNSSPASDDTIPAATTESLTVLTISGSGGTTPILAALAPDFEASTSNYRLETLTGTGTGGGIKGITQGILDVAAMGRPPTDNEAAKIEYIPLGLGAEIPFTADSINVDNLTRQQLTDIFSGKITNWAEVGGPDLDIVVFVRGTDSPHTRILREAIFGEVPFVDTAQVMGGMGDMISAVENTPGAIGYVNWPTARAKQAKVQPIKVNGVGPDDPAYPALLEIGVSYMPTQQTRVAPLVNWLQSDSGRASLLKFQLQPAASN